LFVERNGLAKFFQTTPVVKFEQAIVDLPGAWRQFFAQFERTCRSASVDEEKGWHFLADSSDIAVHEQQLLRRTGKSQDGMVSRFLNRPISRFVTRILLKYPITPFRWTLSILILPLAAFFFLLGGDYAGFVAGAAFFQLYSIVDGCDGEIARAKYLESESGARFDTWCDIIGSLLLVLGVGLGLGQQHSPVYVAEGVVCAALIASNEWFLHRSAAKSDEAANSIGGALYPRHRALVEQMSLMLLGEKIVWWLFQVTKRDVAILFFLCLAIINQPQWILHLSLIVGGVSLALSGVAHGRRRDLRA
jgi:phosphatidylglycerophosphate synthase